MYNIFKRAYDIICSMIGLVLLSPIITMTALMIRCKLGSPVLFKQVRPGYKGRPFTIYKFRTMLNNYDDNGNLLSDDKRLTPFGKKIRNLSLDELPQLVNVLKGELSIVGPRPLLMEYLPLYTPKESRRHDVKPGITGWAQVNGRNMVSWNEKFELDVWYVDNLSFYLDLKILFLTIRKIIKPEGITKKGYVTTEIFRGSK